MISKVELNTFPFLPPNVLPPPKEMSSPPPTLSTLPTELAFLSLFPGCSDSESEEESSAPPKLSSKEERIQRAIDQGKASYNWDQAETKFGVRLKLVLGVEMRG